MQELANLVEREADDVNQMGNLDDNLQAELAAAQYAGNLTIFPRRIPVDLISDQHGPVVFQPPHRPTRRK